MGLANSIAAKANVRIQKIGGLDLLAAEDTEAFLAVCGAEHVLILGVEGFIYEQEALVADMNAIADFSSLQANNLVSESVIEARRFIELVALPGMVFEFVLRGPEENG